jgi:hypothetical protein
LIPFLSKKSLWVESKKQGRKEDQLLDLEVDDIINRNLREPLSMEDNRDQWGLSLDLDMPVVSDQQGDEGHPHHLSIDQLIPLPLERQQLLGYIEKLWRQQT